MHLVQVWHESNVGPSKGPCELALGQTHIPSGSRNVRLSDTNLTGKGLLISPLLLCAQTLQKAPEREKEKPKKEKSTGKIKGGQFPLIKPVIGLRIKLNYRAFHSQSAILSLIRLY